MVVPDQIVTILKIYHTEPSLPVSYFHLSVHEGGLGKDFVRKVSKEATFKAKDGGAGKFLNSFNCVTHVFEQF